MTTETEPVIDPTTGKAVEKIEAKIDAVDQNLDNPPTDAEEFKAWRVEQKAALDKLATELEKLANKPSSQSAEITATLQAMQAQMAEMSSVLISLKPQEAKPEQAKPEPKIPDPSKSDEGDRPAPKPKADPKPQSPPERKRKLGWL